MSYEFKSIKNASTLSQEVQNRIEQAIIEKKYLPGEKLPTEFELCEMFGVSRTAVREALHRLRAKGLIRVKKGSGIYIEDYSPQNIIKPMRLYLELNFDKNYILHIIEVRKLLEPQIAKLAALHRTDEDIDALRLNLGKFEALPPGNFHREGELDGEFHLIIAKASRNPIIPIIVDPIFQIMPKIRILVYAEIEVAKSAAVEYHQKIFDSIVKQDAQKAFEYMTEHLRVAEQHSLEIINKMD